MQLLDETQSQPEFFQSQEWKIGTQAFFLPIIIQWLTKILLGWKSSIYEWISYSLAPVFCAWDNAILFPCHVAGSAHSKIFVCRLCMVKLSSSAGCMSTYFTSCELRCVLINWIWLALGPPSSYPDLQCFEPWTWKEEVFIGICSGHKHCCSSESIACISLHKIMNIGAVFCEWDQQSCLILVVKVIKVKYSSSETNSMVAFKSFASVLALGYNNIKGLTWSKT